MESLSPSSLRKLQLPLTEEARTPEGKYSSCLPKPLQFLADCIAGIFAAMKNLVFSIFSTSATPKASEKPPENSPSLPSKSDIPFVLTVNSLPHFAEPPSEIEEEGEPNPQPLLPSITNPTSITSDNIKTNPNSLPSPAKSKDDSPLIVPSQPSIVEVPQELKILEAPILSYLKQIRDCAYSLIYLDTETPNDEQVKNFNFEEIEKMAAMCNAAYDHQGIPHPIHQARILDQEGTIARTLWRQTQSEIPTIKRKAEQVEKNLLQNNPIDVEEPASHFARTYKKLKNP